MEDSRLSTAEEEETRWLGEQTKMVLSLTVDWITVQTRERERARWIEDVPALNLEITNSKHPRPQNGEVLERATQIGLVKPPYHERELER
ncbi:hypothetical protein DY000_02023667 [Brassica cretica]|uniref:Uncharacterized protein n=1 Tax=Brassica cretica TaxID=69181 RepID=A0ABQ7E5V0_BRACR|nr:hypothetical protein DY000_02023667 [Brassica cretica]